MESLGPLLGQLAVSAVPAPIRYAVVISTSPAAGTAVVRPSIATATDGTQDVTAHYLTPTAPGVGTTVRLDVFQGDILITGSPTLDAYPATPFATASGSAVTPGGGSVAVTFPAGRFTVAPNVTLGIVANAMPGAVIGAYASTPTTSGFTLRVHSTAAPAGGAATVRWEATQMTSTSADG